MPLVPDWMLLDLGQAKGADEEADYWNREYEKLFGLPPNPPVAIGARLDHVASIQSAVMRAYVEMMKDVLRKHEQE